MTSFDTLERSEELSQPIEVYRFVIGAEIFLYTSTEDPITVGAETYQPRAISRSPLQVGRDERGQLMEVRMPQLDPFAVRYLNIVPGQIATVTLIRLQRNEVPTFNTQAVQFIGRVRSVSYNDEDEAVLGCQTLEFSLSRRVPLWVYSGQCNHVLYSSGCGATTTGHTHLGIVTAVAANVVTVQGLAASGKDVVGGFCRPIGVDDFRMVVTQSGDQVTLLLPFAGNPLGLTLECFEGCDHDIAGHCQARFGRGIDYGGYYYVPTKDPWKNGVS